MDTKDVSSPFIVWQREFYPPVQATWTHQGGIKSIRSAQRSVGEKNTHTSVFTCW